jgi:hypothetical protein
VNGVSINSWRWICLVSWAAFLISNMSTKTYTENPDEQTKWRERERKIQSNRLEPRRSFSYTIITRNSCFWLCSFSLQNELLVISNLTWYDFIRNIWRVSDMPLCSQSDEDLKCPRIIQLWGSWCICNALIGYHLPITKFGYQLTWAGASLFCTKHGHHEPHLHLLVSFRLLK